MVEPDVCPTCQVGRAENGVATLPNECCVVYFFGAMSWAHDQWIGNRIRACQKCNGTGYIDAPSHSVERSVFGVGTIGTYVCECRRRTAQALASKGEK